MCTAPKAPKVEPPAPPPPPPEEGPKAPVLNETSSSDTQANKAKRQGVRSLRTDLQIGGGAVSSGLNIPKG